MVHPLLNMTIKGVAWYQGMYLMRRFMNSLLRLHSKVDSEKKAELWISGYFMGGVSCFRESLSKVPRTKPT